jgi:molybdate transport system ATP-binding protein
MNELYHKTTTEDTPMLTIQITKPLHGSSGAMNLDLDLTIEPGSLVAITGASGSGKTTLLRILAGLEEAEGDIRFGEAVWLEGQRSLRPQEREVGLVFQDFALFPNMTVEGNLQYVRDDGELIERLLSMTRLSAFRDRYPDTLSGGQKQRVALARAMMHRPRLLLLDEPLSALDPKMRSFLREKILEVHREFGMTTLMVSHDEREVAQMADRVVRLEHGKIVVDGAAETQKPQNISGELVGMSEEGGRVKVVIQTSQGPVEVTAVRRD